MHATDITETSSQTDVHPNGMKTISLVQPTNEDTKTMVDVIIDAFKKMREDLHKFSCNYTNYTSASSLSYPATAL